MIFTMKRIINNPVVKTILLTVGYLVIILILIIMYGRGNFSTPTFIYQGF